MTPIPSAPAADPRILPLAWEILADPRAIEAEWRALAEKAGAGIYQRFGWSCAFVETIAPAQHIEPAIVTIRSGDQLIALIPLGIDRIGPLRVARILGGEHANIRMPVCDPEFEEELGEGAEFAAAIITALAAHRSRVDLLDLDALPHAWNGRRISLAGHPAARPARLPLGSLRLGTDLAATLDPARRAKKAKKHRSQLNALAPAGSYRFRKVESAAEARTVFARFRAEKAQWFAKMGIGDSFAEAGVPEFFDALIERRWQGDDALLDLFTIEIEGEIRAIVGCGIAGGRMSGYFLSVSDDEWRRITPGELLLHDLIAACCAEGISSIDLGRGDERYKTSWLDAEEPQVRLLLPVSLLGRLGLAAIRLADDAERRLRNNPRLWQFAKKARRRLAGKNRPETDTAG